MVERNMCSRITRRKPTEEEIRHTIKLMRTKLADAPHGAASTQCRLSLNKSEYLLSLLDAERERTEFLTAQLEYNKSPAVSCAEERDAGNGGCGACAICCGELRDKILLQQQRACPGCMSAASNPTHHSCVDGLQAQLANVRKKLESKPDCLNALDMSDDDLWTWMRSDTQLPVSDQKPNSTEDQ